MDEQSTLRRLDDYHEEYKRSGVPHVGNDIGDWRRVNQPWTFKRYHLSFSCPRDGEWGVRDPVV